MVKCTYANTSIYEKGGLILPPLVNVLPSLVQPSPTFVSGTNQYWNCSQLLRCDDQVSSQALRVLNSIARKRGTIDIFISTYFETFHRSLPIIGQDSFYSSLQNSSPTPHFSTLLLSMILISHLSSKISTIGEGNGKEDLYPTLKSIYSLLLSMGKISLELIQTGVIIAAYEHCQALHQDAWLSIGTCARMGQVLGLHHVIQQPVPKEKEERAGFETKRCLWWGVVALERYVLPWP